VPTETGAGRLEEPWKTRVQDLSDRKEEAQSTRHQENVGAWSKGVLNAPGPPRGVVVPLVHLVHSDPL